MVRRGQRAHPRRPVPMRYLIALCIALALLFWFVWYGPWTDFRSRKKMMDEDDGL